MRGPAESALYLQHVTKAFSGVVAVRDVSFDVSRGEVHAIVGENGAGKSTLMSIAAGVIVPEEGAIGINGEPVVSPTPSRMRELGVAVVYQHPALTPDLSIAENLVIGVSPKHRPPIAQRLNWARERLAESGLEIDPARRIRTLSVAQRHLVEIAKAFSAQPIVLILDEPTEPLSKAESDQLFEQIRSASKRGVAVLYISHRLPEVERIADRMTVLRDGAHQGTFDVGKLSEDDILRLIVGQAVASAYPPKTGRERDRIRLRVEQYSSSYFSDLDASFFAGEVVGLAGIEGNGQREFLRGLAGIVTSSGRVFVDGELVALKNTHAAATAGLIYVPADRRSEGLMLPLSVRENLTLATLSHYATAGVMVRDREVAVVAKQTHAFSIKAASPEIAVALLSGGNQQKVLFARAMLTRPKVLLADEPMRSVDAAARLEISRHIRAAAQGGAAVILLSSDALELEGLCDRVLVFSRGHVVAEFAGADVTEANMAHAAVTSSLVRKRDEPAAGRERRFGWPVLHDYAPSALLAVLVLVVALCTGIRNDKYLTAGNFQNFLFLLTSFGFVALGQCVAILAGGIDLSVGSLLSLVIVVASFVVTASEFGNLAGIGLLVAVALAAGCGNGLLVRAVRLTPVIATLVSFFIFQGLALTIRPTPGGQIAGPLVDALGTTAGFIPAVFVLLVLATAGLEWYLRLSRLGLELRAVGSDAVAAYRLGVDVDRVRVGAYALCSLLTCCGALLLAVQIGVGDARAGIDYTLSSIAAVILGGTSIFGGRGSFVGTLLGALLLQQIVNVSTFLQLSSAWQYWLVGALTLVAAASYSRAKSVIAAG